MHFCERLRQLRQEKQLTQKQLAEALHLSSNSICEYEKGRAEPTLETLKKMSSYLDCSVDYLIGNSDDVGRMLERADSSAQKNRLLFAFDKLASPYRNFLLDTADRLQELSDGSKK